MDNRADQAGMGTHDSPDSIRQAGGEDPRRAMFKPVIDRKVRDNDMSGYNHAYTAEAAEFNRGAERKAMGMGTPEPDGTYRR
jgi:type II secretory pathway component PulC